MRSTPDHPQLRLDAREALVPVVTSFAESAALALGLDKPEALDLTLAAEEVFNHLCRVVMPEGGQVTIHCTRGGYYVQLEFTFSAPDFDMRAFNITATVSLVDDAGIEEMGLLLASRFVDRFKVHKEPGEGIKLTLVKEKVYPQHGEAPVAIVKALETFAIKTPEREELKMFARLTDVHYGDQVLPDFFAYPGKLVDMAHDGELKASIAIGPLEAIGGGIFWRWMGTKAVECFGPYMFNQSDDSPIRDALIESCIEAIARTSAIVLINRFPTKEFPRHRFELLGTALTFMKDGTHARREAWARLMQEDIGSVVWVHPQLESFVNSEYTRLVLPREVRQVKDHGEERSAHSVLLTTFDRLRSSVRIEPIWFGKDFESNIVQHLELFRREAILNVSFIMDLGQSWQAEFTPGLLQNRFEPCLILPYAGTGDQVIFQLQEAGQ